MDRNSRLERFSLNATNVAMPIAESTCINLNGSKLEKTRNSATDFYGSPTGFQTRDGMIHRNYRINSNDCMSNDYTQRNYSVNVGGKECSMGQQQINTTIDPRIYTDVQSKGLVTRIVKYHDQGTRVNRSISTSNVYTKPGQFPNVNLKKVELPHRAKSRNLSMTRIAPPEKSLFYGNTLPGILRSNSIVAMQKSDDEISSENRPILHPPQTKNELAPTRSVLEVLKEISRKRINSEQLDPKNNMKKYCNSTVNESERMTPNSQQNKRQREQFNMPSLQQQTSLVAAQNSPEQMPKKRLCSYNNDITSSLSSSRLYTNKRKLHESINNSERIVDSTSSSDENVCAAKPKQFHLQTEMTPTDERLLPSNRNSNNLNKITQNTSSTGTNEPV